jgi:DNA-binding NarL/FixJ family response regulator
MRVVIAEDDPVYQTGLRELLSAAGVEIQHMVSSGRELLEYLAGAEAPDVILLDLEMAERNADGLEAAEVIGKQYPQIGILVLTNHGESAFIRRFYAQGSRGRGYILKEEFNDVDEVRHALNLVSKGKSYSDTFVLDVLHRRERLLEDVLTPRELDVLRLLAAGRSNKAIAGDLRVTEAAVDKALQSIYTKLDIPKQDETRRVHAALRWWRRFGLPDPA